MQAESILHDFRKVILHPLSVTVSDLRLVKFYICRGEAECLAWHFWDVFHFFRGTAWRV